MRLHTTHSQLSCMGWFRRPACPHCGDMQFAAAATELVGSDLIVHTWICDNCEHEFRTAVGFRPRSDD